MRTRLLALAVLLAGCSGTAVTTTAGSSSSETAGSTSGSNGNGTVTGSSGSGSGAGSTGGGASSSGGASSGSSGASSGCEGAYVFCDDFTDAALASSYVTTNGTWTRNTGSYVVSDETAWQRAYALLASDVTDFDVTIRGSSLGDSGLGLIYGDFGGDAFRAVLVHPSQFQGVYLKQIARGASDVDLGSYALPAPLANAPFTLRVVRAGTQVTVWLDGAQVLQASDGASNLHGQLGLLESTTDVTAGAGATFTLLRVDSETPYSAGGSSTGSSGTTGALPGPSTTLAAQTSNDTSASPLFVDDYTNYSVQYAPGSQTSSSNGDMVPGPNVVAVSDGVISKEPLTGLLNSGGTTTPVWVETQTWFCHLASNEDSSSPAKLVSNAKCGSHIDVGYNSDDPAHVARQIDDMLSRGITGALMDWSGKEKNTSSYPTTLNPPTSRSRGSTEVCTNAIYAYMREAESRPAGTFQFAVMEDEGITNCRKGWAGGCACWPSYSSTCNETSQVISDLNYIATNWASSSAYYKVNGKPVVGFFAPDYNACPDSSAADCQTIDWAAVRAHTPSNLLFVFEQKSGLGHTQSGGAFSWLSTGAYPTGNTSFGISYLQDFDGTATQSTKLVIGSVFKGFDDAVTNGWNYASGRNQTRYINQRCGQTWLDTFDTQNSYWNGSGKPDLGILQVVTWDDYEEGTEIETGIDGCLDALTLTASGTQLSWTPSFGSSLTDASIHGSENTVARYELYASSDGTNFRRVASLPRASGNLPRTFDASTL